MRAGARVGGGAGARAGARLRAAVDAGRKAGLRLAAVLVVGCLAIAPGVAGAHASLASEPLRASTGEVLAVLIPALLSAALYVAGSARLRAHETRGRAERAWRAASFGAGLLVLTVSLLPPMDEWSGRSFAIHMVQHEVLMLIAAPLLVLGRPLPLFLWAFSGRAKNAIVRAIRPGSAIRSVWKVLLLPMVAWLLHAIALWAWHAPSWFDAALRSRAVHDFQHITFFVTALLFWAALFEERAREKQGAAVLYLFTTTVHTGVLGAFLTFASHSWYSAYAEIVPLWDLTPLEDQQLGGLIMWIPASLLYVGAGLALLARWIESTNPEHV
jgi:cytochrome c oxidase assembly factor CtaG